MAALSVQALADPALARAALSQAVVGLVVPGLERPDVKLGALRGQFVLEVAGGAWALVLLLFADDWVFLLEDDLLVTDARRLALIPARLRILDWWSLLLIQLRLRLRMLLLQLLGGVLELGAFEVLPEGVLGGVHGLEHANGDEILGERAMTDCSVRVGRVHQVHLGRG